MQPSFAMTGSGSNARQKLLLSAAVLVLFVTVLCCATTQTRVVSAKRTNGKLRKQQHEVENSGRGNTAGVEAKFRLQTAHNAEEVQEHVRGLLVEGGRSDRSIVVVGTGGRAAAAMREVERPKASGEAAASRWRMQANIVDISTLARVEISMAKLGSHRGSGKGRNGWLYAAVSGVGIVGMFAAIVGAMIGLWLDEASEDGEEEDQFCYWDVADGEIETSAGPIAAVGAEREEHYMQMRAAGGLFYSE
jgi:hypothetical protein